MTFVEIVSDICDRLNYTSSDATTRVGKAVNRKYKEITSSIGMVTGRRTEVQASATLGVRALVFSGIEKVIAIIDKSSGANRVLDEVSYETLNNQSPVSELPRQYAIYRNGSQTVTIYLDCIPQTTFTLYAEGHETLDTLATTDEPAFSESYHNILVEGVMVDEYRKMEKLALMKASKDLYEQRMGELRMWIAKSSYEDIYQGHRRSSRIGMASGVSGGGSSINGATSYTQTGLISYSRGVAAPFAVNSGSAKVTNLNADLLDGFTAADFLMASPTVWVDVAYDAGNFTASSGTWTVQSGDHSVYRYCFIGKMVFIKLVLGLTSVSATPQFLVVARPHASITFVQNDIQPVGYCLDNNVVKSTAVVQTTSASAFSFWIPGANWTASTNLTSIYMTTFFEVV